VGFIPYTHALQPAVSKLGQYIKLDVALPQQAVIIKPKVEIADIFLQFLQKQEVNTILQKHGFVMSEGN
jgi:hypothetical protein